MELPWYLLNIIGEEITAANSVLDVMIGITGFTNHIVYEKYDPNSTKSVLNNALSKLNVRELDAIKTYIAAEKN